ncbi:MAG: hypothetical protein M0P12_03355 [Paludibacteraceae bacterium]|nr:hypothetical protein [Paludibacteraceae bacterium]MCK9616000.1 hypothetical protein [Candidatus Omnitrophota bacterium]
MENKELSPELANKVYDILVEECWASESLRNAFVCTETTEVCTEYRFCGNLGFGGKFWNTNDKLYVNYYPEDETPQRDKMMDAANKRLSKLVEETKITLQMPVEAAERLLEGWQDKDPVLLDMLKGFDVKEITRHEG